jgi:metallo-beta-lactamase family protein
MGKNVLQVFSNHQSWHKLSIEQSHQILKEIRVVSKPEETQKLAKDTAPKIILAASGMATGGRVLTYFEHYLGQESATILMVGYQGEGTRGRALLEGATEVKMRGKYWPVKAECVQVEGLSAHADQNELTNWLDNLVKEPEKLFIVHGNPESTVALSEKLNNRYGYHCIIPELNELFRIPMD